MESRHALHVAVGMANDSGAELVLAHAWYLPALAFGAEPPPAITIQSMVEEEEQGLEAAATEATGLGTKRVRTLLLTGMPWVQIVDTLQRDHRFDLVVMGTHGRTGLGHVVLGSVAENVVRNAPCSVLVTHGSAMTFKHLLCPTDFSECSRVAVDTAAALARPLNAELTLLHIVDMGEISRSLDSVAEIERRSTETLEHLAGELRGKGAVSVTTRSQIGTPETEVVAFLASDPTIDLVVVGSHGRTGIRRAIFGSVAEKIVRQAPCSVFVARARHD